MINKLANFILRSFMPGDAYARRIGVTVGQGCRILSKHFGSEPFLITIGDNVTVSHGVTFVNHDGVGWLIRDEKGRRYLYRRILIGDNCFIGANSTIMPGVQIEDDVVVGAGSVVTRSVPRGFVVGGNPARKITTFNTLRDKAIKWVAESELDKQLEYEERVLAVLDPTFKPPLA